MRLKNTVILILLTLSGCGGTQYQWVNDDHNDTNRFRRESAECKLMAENAARGIRYQSNTAYIVTTDRYGGHSTTNVQPNPYDEFANNLSTALEKDSTRQETYELCMQTKGYYQVKKSSNKRPSKIALGGPCVEHKDCAGENMCGQKNKCISKRNWQAEANQRWIKKN